MSRKKRGEGWANLDSVRTPAPETSRLMPHQPAGQLFSLVVLHLAVIQMIWHDNPIVNEWILRPRGCERCHSGVDVAGALALHRRRLRRDRRGLGQQLFLPVPKQDFIRIPLHISIKDVDRILNSFLLDVQHRQTSIRFFQ